jgi:hypothetical protein
LLLQIDPHVSFITEEVQAFDEAISGLQQEDQGADGGYFY